MKLRIESVGGYTAHSMVLRHEAAFGEGYQSRENQYMIWYVLWIDFFIKVRKRTSYMNK